LVLRHQPTSPLFPYTTLFRSGELAGEMTVRILVHDAANIARIVTREGAVHDHLRHRDLAAHRLAARFEINRIGKAFLGLLALRRSEEHTSELQSPCNLVCRLL